MRKSRTFFLLFFFFYSTDNIVFNKSVHSQTIHNPGRVLNRWLWFFWKVSGLVVGPFQNIFSSSSIKCALYQKYSSFYHDCLIRGYFHNIPEASRTSKQWAGEAFLSIFHFCQLPAWTGSELTVDTWLTQPKEAEQNLRKTLFHGKKWNMDIWEVFKNYSVRN